MKTAFLILGVCLLALGSIFLAFQFSPVVIEEGSFEESIDIYETHASSCNPLIQPQSIEIDGQRYTKATPNHQRPCSLPILFGGKE